MTQTHNIYKPARTARQSSIARNSTDIRSAIAVLKFQLSIIRITHYWRTLQLLRSPAVSAAGLLSNSTFAVTRDRAIDHSAKKSNIL
ncbi:hypothetical protein [Tychonema sp. LEGE 06208]|uniref:hypothetical protein n=1 Tax=Tychonema sp. LEGE 06208 TaxID=1828663 RepID=UPI0018822557|nr:hypothetical protein [Tychonema sp. LEGE 06208]MBE9164411.1 hypothetical protein [Tychonema sp. LEGE 06208]